MIIIDSNRGYIFTSVTPSLFKLLNQDESNIYCLNPKCKFPKSRVNGFKLFLLNHV